MMKPEDFETRMAGQPLKPIPAQWRAEILAAARAEAASRTASPTPRPAWFTVLANGLAGLLWPHPRAWAGLAAAWILVAMVNISIRETAPAGAQRTVLPAAEMTADLRQQRLVLAELIGAGEPRGADRQLPLAPKPRSSRRDILSA